MAVLAVALASVSSNVGISSDVRRQLREETKDDTLTQPERFILEQKYGLHDPFLFESELRTIKAEAEGSGR